VGIDNKYKTTMISPLKENSALVPQIGIYIKEVAIAASAKNGSNRNITFLPFPGTRFSLASNFTKSANGWNQGGPTLFCSLAYSFLSTYSKNMPDTLKNNNPGKTKI